MFVWGVFELGGGGGGDSVWSGVVGVVFGGGDFWFI